MCVRIDEPVRRTFWILFINSIGQCRDCAGNDLTDASPRGASGLSGAAERVVRKRRRRLGWQRNY